MKRYFTEKEKKRFSELINDERKHPARFVNDMYITNFGWEESIRNYCFDVAKYEFDIDIDNTTTDDTIDFISYMAYKLMLSISKTKKWKIDNYIIEVGEKLTKSLMNIRWYDRSIRQGNEWCNTSQMALWQML